MAVNPDSTDLRIRPIRAADYEAVCDLWRAADLPARLSGREAPDAFLRQLAHHPDTYLLAEVDEHLAGVVLGTHDHRKGWINRLAVHPDFRSRGVAQALLAACEHALRRNGLEIVSALIEHGNDASRAAFERAGYLADLPVHYYRKRFRAEI